MIYVVLAVVASVTAGVAAERRSSTGAQRLGRRTLDVMLYVLVPFVTFFNIAHLHITRGVGVGIGLGYAELAVVGIAAWVIGERVLRLSRPVTGALICATVLANTGYLGLPLAVALLGPRQLGTAIAFDTLVSAPMLLFVGFAVGAAFGGHAGDTRGERVRAYFARNPPLLAVAAGLLAPRSLAPALLVSASHVVVFALLPLGFFTLGINLAVESDEGVVGFPPRLTAPIATVLGLRLLAAPALMLILSALVVAVPAAYLLQAAMPCGINSLIVAHAYGLDLRLVAGALAWSTAVVMVVGLVVTNV